MPIPDIELTSQERALFDRIQFDAKRMDFDGFARNGEHVVALMRSLLASDVIPKARRRHYTDPEYRTGRMKGSRRDLLLRNLKNDDEVMRDASFLKHLRYFVCGPDLPADAMRRFREEVDRCGQVSGSDAIDLGKFARQEVRTLGLPPREACEEYFKLALDCGIWVSWAYTIRDKVKSIK